ncbi:MAG: hypothetical protein ACOC3A_11465 [Thermodesulfobacteriota bacterium]
MLIDETVTVTHIRAECRSPKSINDNRRDWNFLLLIPVSAGLSSSDFPENPCILLMAGMVDPAFNPDQTVQDPMFLQKGQHVFEILNGIHD